MNNHYIPDITDFRFGYEYEFGIKRLKPPQPSNEIYQSWEKRVICHYLDFEGLEQYIEEGEIRVPYLTKEQIIDDGWEYIGQNCVSPNVHYFKSKNGRGVDLDAELHTIKIGEDDEYPEYNGECKSINEFRLIIKLLEI